MNFTNNNFTSTISSTLKATLSNDLTFKDIIIKLHFSMEFLLYLLFLLLCVVTFIILILKSKKKLLFSTHL